MDKKFLDLMVSMKAVKENMAEQTKLMNEMQDAILYQHRVEILATLQSKKTITGYFYGKQFKKAVVDHETTDERVQDLKTLTITRAWLESNSFLMIKASQLDSIPILIEGIWDMAWFNRRTSGFPFMTMRAFVIQLTELYPDATIGDISAIWEDEDGSNS